MFLFFINHLQRLSGVSESQQYNCIDSYVQQPNNTDRMFPEDGL
jgi:hypothetical protein